VKGDWVTAAAGPLFRRISVAAAGVAYQWAVGREGRGGVGCCLAVFDIFFSQFTYCTVCTPI